MKTSKTDSTNWAEKTEQNARMLGYWTAAWVLTMAIANFGPRFFWDFNVVFTVVAILVNLAIGFGMILANKHHLKGLDEMHQKIQLEAMALSLGVGLVVGLAYSNLDVTNIIAADAEISHLIILMSLVYAAGVFVGLRKYR